MRDLEVGLRAARAARPLAQPWANIILRGAVSVDTLKSNLAAMPELWDAELAQLAAPLAIPAAV